MKRRILYLLTFVLCTVMQAQDITEIDWNVLRVDSMQLPIYCETLPLADDFRRYDYDVRVEYPEWTEPSPSEAALLARHDVPSALQVETHVGIDNRKGLLDLQFVPVVRDGNAYKKLKSCRITVLATPKAHTQVPTRANAAERYAASSVLASGRWVKIRVAQEGVYRLTKQQLASMGFKNPDRVRVFGYGGRLLSEVLDPNLFYDDLPEVPLIKAPDGSLLFWADGVVDWKYATKSSVTSNHITNYCSTHSYYFVTEGEPMAMPQEESLSETPRQIMTTFTEKVLLDKDEYAWAPLGRKLFERASTQGSTRSYSIDIPGSVTGKTASVQISMSANASGRVTPVINGEECGVISFGTPDKYAKAVIKTINYSVPVNAPTIQVQMKATEFEARLDYIEVHYDRHLECSNALKFRPTTTGPTAFKFYDWNDKMQLIRLPEPTLPCARIMPRADSLFAVTNAQHRYVAINTAASFPSPAVVGAIENQNLHADSTEVDMVIITPVSGIFDSEAQRLADAHAATDGLRCRVVRADKIYNEFSSGTPDVSAYRMYMKMLYERQAVAPRYLLLFGDCAADNRMISRSWVTFDRNNFLLCFESENSTSDTDAYVCEDYLGMLDDGEGGNPKSDKGDVSVGRFTVRTRSEAKVMVDKTIEHLRGTTGVYNNRVVILGDDGDKNSHMKFADLVADTINIVAPDIEVIRVMWDAYKRVSSSLTNTFPDAEKQINRLNNEGVMMFNYTGHGATYLLSHESVIKLEEIKKWTNKHKPLWFTAACDVMPIDGIVENLGEQMVLNPNGGGVAFVGTTRTVYAAQNFDINRDFTAFLLECDANGRRFSVGDALRKAKTSGGVSNTVNKLHYVLVGDPSLVFGNPSNKVVLDSINGEAINNQLLKAGSRVVMSGHIVNAAGDSIPGFNGIMTARVLDSEVTVTCANAAKAADAPFVFTDRNKVLYEGTDSVKNGRFSFSFVVPVDINYSGKEGRVNFYAATDSMEANGHSTAFLVGGISNELADDKQGPDVFVTLNDADFVEGGLVSSTPCFMAAVSDENGINTVSGTVGHNLELSVDGRVDMTYDVSEYYTAEAFGKGTVIFPMPEMNPGEHTLSFRAWDLLNNPTTRKLSFVVDKNFCPEVGAIHISPNPAKTYTNIYVTHNSAGSSIEVEINVYDYAGRLVHSFTRSGNEATKTVYVTWDLTTGSARLGGGIYLVRSRICRDGVWSDGETQKLLVLGQ